MAERESQDPAGLAVPLGLALAQLPMEVPERDAWPQLSARLAARRRPSRWPLALAASLLLGLLMLPRPSDAPGKPDLATQPAAGSGAPDARLAPLMAQSASLERLLAAADDGGGGSASATALSLAYEDQLHSLDAELAANTDPARALPLWQRRVELLRSVAAVETSRRYLAAQGGNFDVALVAAY
jgi:hypothetical protein